MKRTFLFFCIILVTLLANAQQDSLYDNDIHFENQIGLNVSAFVKTYLSFNTLTITAPANTPNFLIDYKGLVSDREISDNFKIGIRLGMNFQNNDTRSGTDTTYTDSQTKNYVWRVGVELQQKLSKRWNVFYGFDFFSANATTVSENKIIYNSSTPATTYLTTTNTNITNLNGFGPLLGIQYNLTRHINLSTETWFYFINGTTSNKYDYTVSDGSNYLGSKNQSTTGTITQQTLLVPLFVTLHVMF